MNFEFVEQGQERYGPPAPVQIIQEEVEFAQLLELYRERAPKNVLEIGTYAGGTLFHWLQNATQGANVTAVDDCGYGNVEVWDTWAPEGVVLHVVCGDTRDPDVIRQVAQHGLFDWVFIDAGHMDDEVREDWKNYSQMTARPAVVAFHDIVELPTLPRIQVFHLWRELRERYDHREILSDGGSGIGVLFL